MNLKTLRKSLFCMLAALLASLPSTAQDNLSGVYGTYTGTMPTKITKDGNVTEGTTKTVSFVFSPGEDGSVSITLKGYAVGRYSLEDILLPGNAVTETESGWTVVQGNPVGGSFMTRDGVHSISLVLTISGATVSRDGTCTLSLGVRYTDTDFVHEFNGRKATTGIRNVNSVQKASRAVYDLQGRRVEKPGHGIYIVGGRKVVM